MLKSAALASRRRRERIDDLEVDESLVEQGGRQGGRRFVVLPRPRVRRGDGRLVMLVDDDPDMVAMYKLGLEAAGFSVEAAGDSVELFRAMETRLPDLIVLDWQLPGARGDEILHQLRLDERTRPLPVFMLSNFPPQVEGAIDRVFRDGALAWFEKSKTSPLLLAEKLAEALGLEHQAEGA